MDGFELTGAAILGGEGCGCEDAGCPLPISISGSAPNTDSRTRDVNSPVTWIDLLAGTGIASVLFVLISVKNSSSFAVRFTTAEAADQVVALADFWAYVSKTSGRQITALAVRGVGTMKLRLAGNTT